MKGGFDDFFKAYVKAEKGSSKYSSVLKHRALKSFVSQQVIRLLTSHNITQQSGEPYTKSCPKGFFQVCCYHLFFDPVFIHMQFYQAPELWITANARALELVGWPQGLPEGTISQKWSSDILTCVSAMLIQGTITIRRRGSTHRPLASQQSRVGSEQEISEEVIDLPARTSDTHHAPRASSSKRKRISQVRLKISS